MGPKSGWGPVRSGGDRLCQTRLIPRSPDGDKKGTWHFRFLSSTIHQHWSASNSSGCLLWILGLVCSTHLFPDLGGVTVWGQTLLQPHQFSSDLFWYSHSVRHLFVAMSCRMTGLQGLLCGLAFFTSLALLKAQVGTCGLSSGFNMHMKRSQMLRRTKFASKILTPRSMHENCFEIA